jgi:hypothetical protein
MYKHECCDFFVCAYILHNLIFIVMFSNGAIHHRHITVYRKYEVHLQMKNIETRFVGMITGFYNTSYMDIWST